MKLLFDQNISPRILKYFSDQWKDCSHVRFEGLENASDSAIFNFAKDHGYAIVTFDADFIDLNALRGTPPKVIWLNTGNLTTKSITALLERNVLQINYYLESESDQVLELVQ